jgi:subtilisin
LDFSPIAVLAQDKTSPQVVRGRFAPKIPDDGLTPWQRRLKKFDRLIYKAAQEGTISVGIDLDRVLPQPKSESMTLAEELVFDKVLQDTAFKTIENFLKKYPQLRKTITYQAESFPTLAFEVDATTLGQLKYDKSIISIGQDGGEEEDRAAPSEMPEPLPTKPPNQPQLNLSSTALNSPTGSGKVIIIIDSGIDKTHPAFAGKIIQEACFSTYSPSAGIYSLCPGNGTQTQVIGAGAGINCPITLDQKECYHGTHVAGIALGNSSGLQGIAKDAKLIPIQVFNKYTDPSKCSGKVTPCAGTTVRDNSNVSRALNWVITNRIKYGINIVSISLGAYDSYNVNQSSCNTISSQMKSRIDKLKSYRVPVIISSGNNNYLDAISFPACISSAISVGATDNNDKIWVKSSGNGTNTAPFLNLLALGYNVKSSVPAGTTNSTYCVLNVPSSGWCAYFSGTSM